MQLIEQKIQEILEKIIEDSSLFLVELFIKPTNNIKIFLDGDQGVTVNAIAKINRALYVKIEEAELFEPGDFSLEVSSAGLSKPLKLKRQYNKNIGRLVQVHIKEEPKSYEGILEEVNEQGIIISYEEGKRKKDKKTIHKEILFEAIDKTIVQAVFK
ncbi:MAG TPA: hypothetical protein VK027_01835 [Chitinophagaceae bacterium]|nr:hypothetical protein [Chitinophagaceae bacterium]